MVTFIDITETKRAERVQAARLLAESIVDAVREPLLVLDATLRVVRANRSFYRAFRVEPAQTEGQRIDELGSRQWSVPRLRELLEATLRDGAPFDDFEVVHEIPADRAKAHGAERPPGLAAGRREAGPDRARHPGRGPGVRGDPRRSSRHEREGRQVATPSLDPTARREQAGGRSRRRSREADAGRDPRLRPRAGGPPGRAGDPEPAARGGSARGGRVEGALSPALRVGADRIPHARSRRRDRGGESLCLRAAGASARAAPRAEALELRRRGAPGPLALRATRPRGERRATEPRARALARRWKHARHAARRLGHAPRPAGRSIWRCST